MLEKDINMYALYSDLAGLYRFNLGDMETVYAFFSNIAYNLENKKWESVYPTIMNEFYHGKIEPSRINYAIAEIKDIKKKLNETKVSKMIWDFNDTSKLIPFYVKPNSSLDDVFKNDKGIKITDIILNALNAMYNKNETIYLGDYYLKDIYNENTTKKIIKSKNKMKKNTIIKYIIYILIIITVKLIVPKPDFIRFLKIFIFSMIVSLIFEIHTKININSKIKEKELENEEYINYPKFRIEQITLKRDLRSSMFDNLLDEINCPKTFDKIKEKLELKRIRTWKSDINKIYQTLGYKEYYANEIIEYLSELNKLEIYNLNISKINLSKEQRGILYSDNNTYRIISTDKELYLIIYFNRN